MAGAWLAGALDAAPAMKPSKLRDRLIEGREIFGGGGVIAANAQVFEPFTKLLREA